MRNQPIVTPISYSYIKSDQDIRVLNWKELPVLEAVKDTQIIYFSASTVGGNHRHPRTEWYICFGDLILYWLDETGKRHQKCLNPKGRLLLVKIPPFLAHAVRNRSATNSALLLELADAPQNHVERIKVY
jgi:hypothetical protein